MASLNEMFMSVQGEGSLAGLPTFFVRFFGCNLDCPWCDQPTALGTRTRQVYYDQAPEEIAQVVCAYPPDVHVCFTGGEPAFQHVELVETLQAIREIDQQKYGAEGRRVRRTASIETNGSIFVKDFAEEMGTFASVSPKANNTVINGRQEMHGNSDIVRWIKSDVRMQLKFVVEHVQHFEGILKWLAFYVPEEHRVRIPVYFQPEWYQRDKFKEVLKYCLTSERMQEISALGFREVRFVSQQHKDLNVR